jgi:hypothetical protein
LSVRQRRGSELDRGHSGVHAAQGRAPVHPAYVATCARAALNGGLHNMLSTVAAWPAKWVARGPCHRAPGAASSAGVATAVE